MHPASGVQVMERGQPVVEHDEPARQCNCAGRGPCAHAAVERQCCCELLDHRQRVRSRAGGPDAFTCGGGVPRRAARRGSPPTTRAASRPATRTRFEFRRAWQRAAARGRLGRRVVAEGVRRPRRDADRAGDLQRGDRPRPRAAGGQRARAGDGRPDRDRPRHRGAARALPASRSCRPRRSGARASPSPTRAPTWPR